VLDGAVAIFDAVAGVQPQTETVWRQADRYRVPRIAFVNKMDRVGADFDYCIRSMRARLTADPAPIQFPLGKEDSFIGIMDFIEDKVLIWKDESLGAEFETFPLDQIFDEEFQAQRLPTSLNMMKPCSTSILTTSPCRWRNCEPDCDAPPLT
jgi:elongation factor G